MPGISIEDIARVVHEANRAYCQGIGDTSQPSWDEAPEWQRKSAIEGVHKHLDALDEKTPLPPSASHESWLAEKLRDGWKWGAVKNPDKKEHPCIVPYNELPVEQRAKDYIFGAVIKAIHGCYRTELMPSGTRTG
jgi:hypothetical protein